MTRVLITVALVGALGVRALAADAPVNPTGDPVVGHVEYRDDRLTVRVDGAPLAAVLAEVGRVSGAEVRGQPPSARTVSAEFEVVPLIEALPRLLGDQNFTLRYGDGGRLRAIVLEGGAEARLPPPAVPAAGPAAAAAQAPAQPPPITALPHRFVKHRPVLLPEQLARVVGRPIASFEQLFVLATQHSDGTVRALSTQVTLSALERERPLRRSLFASLHHTEDGSMGAFLQGPGAIEMLEFMAAHSREPGLQKKATALLEQLRAAPAGG